MYQSVRVPLCRSPYTGRQCLVFLCGRARRCLVSPRRDEGAVSSSYMGMRQHLVGPRGPLEDKAPPSLPARTRDNASFSH
ncbi:hypothetical protein BHM03_00002447 [Ensete ventricosum]|nr:hypothetical protein BHM03_00002447 [Ensete ventricosum]